MESLLKRIDEKKKKFDSYKPLPAALAKNLDEWFKIELTYTSNAIEGNTLSAAQTALVVEKGITVAGKTIIEHLEAINHAKAVDFIKQLAHTKQRIELTVSDILTLHKIVLQKIDDSNAGYFRRVSVRILGSHAIFPNYVKVPNLMDQFMDWLHSTHDHPIIIATQAHFKLVDIHPFSDGNGRTARLFMNLILLQNGYPLTIIRNDIRTTYINALEHARQTKDFIPFYTLVGQAVEHSLEEYLNAITESELTP